MTNLKVLRSFTNLDCRSKYSSDGNYSNTVKDIFVLVIAIVCPDYKRGVDVRVS